VRETALLILLVLAWATLGASAQIAKKPQHPKIAVSTHLDRTAIWVGDTFRYTVRALHDPDIEFVLENLKKESLNLPPFVVRDVGVRQGSFGSNKKFMEVILFLTTYETGQAELRIPSLTLYYFTRASGLHKAAETPAESYSVPPSKIGLRSTLTADNLRPRDSKEIWQVTSQTWIVSFVLGLSGMTFLALGAGRRLWTLSRSETPKRQHLTRRARNRMFDEFLRKTQMIGRSSAEDQVRFYSEVSQFVREYLSEWLEIDASSLTPEELEIVLKNLGRDKLGAAVKTVLERCERVLYTPQGSELGKDWRDEVQRELGALAERRLARGER
jgi:hypothetical protein